MRLPVAVFVTPHGFGHAARTCAVLSALDAALGEGVEAHLFTLVPEWFFAASLELPFHYHPLECDVGLVQRDALQEDPAATVARLRDFLPLDGERAQGPARWVGDLGCRLVLCDVAPLGIAVGRRAGVPAVLVENFTWDWIYRAYAGEEPFLARAAEEIAAVVAAADLRLQTVPACDPVAGGVPVPPVARAPRRGRQAVRRALGTGDGERLVLVTMGGIPWDFRRSARLPVPAGVTLVVPGGAEEPRRVPGALLLPHRSGFYHPDLMAASDAVLGKLGYSTLAEAWRCGLPYAFIPRQRFPESPVLARFVAEEMAGFAVAAPVLEGEDLAAAVERLLDLPRRGAPKEDGAAVAAAHVRELLVRRGRGGRQ